jgi:hypothetical protein
MYLHGLIFDMCYYGKMGYDDVYAMPVHYRSFYMRKLAHMKEREAKEYEKMNGGGSSSAPSQNIARGPAIQR